MASFVTLDNAAITELLQGSSGPVHADTVRRTLNVHGAAVKRCPVGQSRPGYTGGRLRSSIRFAVIRDSSGVVGFVGTDVIYAEWASEHAIDPEKRHYLERALEEAGK